MRPPWLRSAVDAIRSGAVIGVPTDTVYGVAADPRHERAVGELYRVKGRPEHKPIGLLAASIAQVEELADLGAGARLARRHWPGALTLVVVPRVLLPDWVGTTAVRTVGIRVPDHDGLRLLLEETGPLAVTSANRSGGEEVHDDIEARAIFGDEISVYVPGRSPGGVASTVVDVTGGAPVVLREGPLRIDADDGT